MNHLQDQINEKADKKFKEELDRLIPDLSFFTLLRDRMSIPMPTHPSQAMVDITGVAEREGNNVSISLDKMMILFKEKMRNFYQEEYRKSCTQEFMNTVRELKQDGLL